ncbi:MAG: AAA family ATPase, partial [Deltaproteobacteria bacterium]|nr:AAA family ATPase [Deltaproteobacteria bacterium]
MLSTLQGQIERVTYTNEQTGYTIVKMKVSGREDLVTVVGSILTPTPGEILQLEGEWTTHPKFGEQFKVVRYETVAPASVYGIRKYLGSGLIRGIGPVMAERIVDRFGKDALTVIEQDITRLAEIEGIGTRKIEMIAQAWDEQKEIRNVMLFLQDHNVGAGHAAKIFKQYGSNAIAVVKENPYRLANDIFGIGFVTADSIAEKIGITKDAEMRVEAGIQYVLNQLTDDGHVYYPYEPLIKRCRDILKVNRDVLAQAFATIAREKRIIIEDLNQDIEEFSENNKAVYLAQYHACETGIAEKMGILAASRPSLQKIDAAKAITKVQKQLSITLADNQIEAVEQAITSKVMVITGGPGTGKSTIINAILKIFSGFGINILLGAPTGRAAKRMSEITGYTAKTIHRLLKYSPGTGTFEFNAANPLQCDLLIIDEASMIDTVLMYHLTRAIPPTATLVMVGDVNQLPSVGPGNVLKDIIDSGAVTVVELNEIFRQARESRIIVNAHLINSGRFPSVPKS